MKASLRAAVLAALLFTPNWYGLEFANGNAAAKGPQTATSAGKPALYEIANVPGNENKPGAMITLSPYAPLTKFDLNKDANEDVFKSIASRIVADLTTLLNANPSAMSQ